jgi:hypothetical protein
MDTDAHMQELFNVQLSREDIDLLMNWAQDCAPHEDP